MRRVDNPGLIVRQKTPLNLEYQFESLGDWVTPADQFFVRGHFPTPEIDAASWTLRVDGAVGTLLSLGLDEIRAMPAADLTAVAECAGNGRVFYEPAREGLQWQSGAVGNASWRGVLLSDVLARAGLAPEAVDVVLIGADRGVVDGGKKTASPGPIAFSRSLPVAKATSGSVLLAYGMNGEALTPEHGYPLRAVVGGWYGMAWVKWIASIRVVDRPFLGYWQSRDYFRWDRSLGEPVLSPLSEIEVKAQIARPVNGSAVRVGERCRIFGAAWSGEAPIARVLVCIGDGEWQEAGLQTPSSLYGWRFWFHDWTPDRIGRQTLRCKAVDKAGNTQPETQQPDRESYLANWSVPVEVRVVAADAVYVEEFVI